MKIINLSEGSISNAYNLLYRYFKDVEETFDTIPSEQFQNWFIEHQKVWKERTVTNYLSVLSSFYNFQVEEGVIGKSPIKSIWYPRLPKPIPKYLEEEEITKVRIESEKGSLRNRAIVEFLLASGCRVGEVYGLNKSDVDLENQSARVLGKGKKIRTVHFTEKCAHILEQYLESRTDEEPALFSTSWGTRLGVSSIRKIISRMGERSEVSGSLHPHRFRHTFATRLLKKGADLLFIADELGHNNLQTTQVYAHLPKKELITMYRKYMG